MADYYFRTQKMSVGYQNIPLISDMDFGLNKGEILTLIGPNGAGKSTILKSIARQLSLVAGTAFLDGKELTEYSGAELSQRMAVVFTDKVHGELMTCEDVVATGRYPYTGHFGLLSAKDRQAVKEAMELVHISELKDRQFGQVSDGQRQRIMLARAICQEPEIILLDEPTSYLDIRYQLEFLKALQEMTAKKKLSVIMSLHEMDLAQKISDKVLCIGEGGVERFGTPEEIFAGDYVCNLFHIKGKLLDYANSLGYFTTGEVQYMMKNQKQLRCGITTGTCAAAAAKGAAALLIAGVSQEGVKIQTPKGVTVTVPVKISESSCDRCECMVIKDSGDDPDVTNHAEIYVSVEKLSDDVEASQFVFTDQEYPRLWLDGGEGIGRITRQGLEQQIGQAAINTVPRQMIFEAVGEICKAYEYRGKLLITVRIPEGRKLAERTFNPVLGIEGGISVLGTSGILEPMSEKAIIDTIEAQIRQLKAQGGKSLLITPGNYGQGYVSNYLKLNLGQSIKCSNYIGETLDLAISYGMEDFLLVGNIGKLIKLAAGIMNTHSKVADGRGEIMAVHAVLQGGTGEMARELMNCITTEEMLGKLEMWGLKDAVMESLCDKIQEHMSRRAGNRLRFGVILFSEKYGFLGQTQDAQAVLETMKEAI